MQTVAAMACIKSLLMIFNLAFWVRFGFVFAKIALNFMFFHRFPRITILLNVPWCQVNIIDFSHRRDASLLFDGRRDVYSIYIAFNLITGIWIGCAVLGCMDASRNA